MNKQQIINSLNENYHIFAEYISNLSESDFMFSDGEKWTAGQQLDHLVRSVVPLKRALALPNFVPKLLFGKADRPSMSYDELVAKYQAKLAEGGRASGRFIPATIPFSESNSLKEKLLNTVAGLCKNVESFSESQLDEFFLPHPLLGNLTVREMLMFTIYHAEHHLKSVKKNLGK